MNNNPAEKNPMSYKSLENKNTAATGERSLTPLDRQTSAPLPR